MRLLPRSLGGQLALLLVTALLAAQALALALFALGLIGLGVSMFPYVVPGAITIWDAASPEKSQMFMLVGAVVLIPIILIYTGYSYWVFRGKTGHEGYH